MIQSFAVIKLKKASTSALGLGLLALPCLAHAGETFTYTGNNTDPHWGNTPFGSTLTSAGPNDNSMTINITNDIPLYAIGGSTNTGGVDTISNTATMNGGTVGTGAGAQGLYGGYAASGGNAISNTVTLNGGLVNGSVMGGRGSGATGNANGNTVNINGGTVSVTVTGGWTGTNGVAEYNTVTVRNGTMASVTGGSANNGNVTNNAITIYNGILTTAVGGWTEAGRAENNAVTLISGTVNSYIYGGRSNSGNASSNTITISGGLVNGDVIGGTTNSGNATNNTITISGGTFGGTILGGYAPSGNAINNTISLSGNADLTAATLRGGQASGSDSANTLNLNGYSGSVVAVSKFSNYNFELPASVTNGSTILHISGGTGVNLSGTTVAITGLTSGGTALHVGDTITLIDKVTNTPASFVGTNISSGLLTYNFAPVVAGNAYQAQVTGGQAAAQTKALAEGHLAAMTTLIQGQDLIAGRGMDTAMRTIPNGAANAFITFSGGHNRYNTGSHIDTNGASMLFGIGKKSELEHAALLSGFFLEIGHSNYDSTNTFASGSSVKGSGNSSSYGVGYLGRLQIENGAYMEGSVRAGSINGSFNSNDLRTATGTTGDYKTSSAYYGAHVGVGKEQKVSHNLTVTPYTKFLWNRQNGSHVDTLGGDQVSFGAINSKRLQLGGDVSHKIGEATTLTTGLAYQYEFSGKTNASLYGYGIGTPSLKGSSAIAKVGVSHKYANTLIDANVQGSSGKTKGLGGNIGVSFKF